MAAKSIITKEELLKVAMRMVEEKGLDSINARDLAHESGISTKPIYRLYLSLDDLKSDINAIIKKEYDEFIMKRVDNKKALITLCVAYIEFAKKHKNYFKSLFLSNNLNWTSIDNVLNEKWNQGAIISMVNKQGLTFEEAKNLFMNLWVYSNGLATLIACNDINLDNKEILIKVVKMYKELTRNLKILEKN